MAYQNVGTPRFYVNDVMWILNMNAGSIDTEDSNFTDAIFNMNPSNQYRHGGAINAQYTLTAPLSNGYNYVAWLGHNFATAGWECFPKVNNVTQNASSGINYNQGAVPPYDGFTFQFFGDTDGAEIHLTMLQSTGEQKDAYCGSISAGKYYDMPHSPELSLTMTREMDGVKRVRTRGGSDLVKHQYIRSPKWGDLAPWELSSGTAINQDLARVGRRTWDLSFNYLQDSDIFPDLSNVGWEGTYENYNDSIGNTLLDDNTFFSQVLHKAHNLPFIFQPDTNDNNISAFAAICKFDMKSFQFNQVANNTYNINLKIKEIW